jgi:hypothetical protein
MPAKLTLGVTKGPIAGQVFTFARHVHFRPFVRLSREAPGGGRQRLAAPLHPGGKSPDAWVRDLGSLNGTIVNGVAT